MSRKRLALETARGAVCPDRISTTSLDWSMKNILNRLEIRSCLKHLERPLFAGIGEPMEAPLFASPIRSPHFLGMAMIGGSRWSFSQPAERRADFGTIAIANKPNGQDWRFPLNFSQSVWAVAGFSSIAAEESAIAMIGGFRGIFPKPVAGCRGFWHDGGPIKA